MKRILSTLCLAVLLGSSGACLAADFQKGGDAVERGGYATALKEWTPLAEQGYVSAQSYLAMMYVNGEGVIQDNVYAYMWWNIAASTGEEKAVKNRDVVAEKITP